jgi:hypothetical protein
MSTDLEWYGYQHIDGSVHLKRHTPGDDPVARDLAGNAFVAAIVPPFSAPDRASALAMLKERLHRPATLAELFDAYRRTGIPRDAPAVQVSEMRKGFYCGAAAILSIMAGFDDDMDEEVGAQHLGNLDAECRAFFKRLRH